MLQCQRLDRIARGQTVGETSTHDAGKQGNSDALTQVKFPNRRFLLLGRHDAIFGNSCQTRRRDTDEANENSKKNYAARGSSDNLVHELTTEDGGISVPNAAQSPSTTAMPSERPK